MILDHFEDVIDVEEGVKISASDSEFVVVDLQNLRIVEVNGHEGAKAIETDLREILGRATES